MKYQNYQTTILRKILIIAILPIAAFFMMTGCDSSGSDNPDKSKPKLDVTAGTYSMEIIETTGDLPGVSQGDAVFGEARQAGSGRWCLASCSGG